MHDFFDQKWQNGHMSVWSGKRSPCLLSPSPCLSPCLLSLSRSRSGPSGPKDVVHFLTFSTPNGHVPFWSKKWCENSYVSHYFSTWSNLMTFGPKNHQIQQSFPVSNRHVQKWKFHLPEMLKFPREFAHFWEVKFPFLHMLIWDRKILLKSMVFWTKTDKVAPSPKVV